MKATIGLGGIALCALFALVAQSAEETIQPEKLPAAVLNAIHGRFPGGTINSAAKEIENDQIIYDIELKHENRKYEMDIKEDGTVLEIEKEIAIKDLLPAIVNAVEAKYPKATIKEVMEVNKVVDKQERPDHYEVVIESAEKKTLELIVSLDGKTVGQEPSGKTGNNENK